MRIYYIISVILHRTTPSHQLARNSTVGVFLRPAILKKPLTNSEIHNERCYFMPQILEEKTVEFELESEKPAEEVITNSEEGVFDKNDLQSEPFDHKLKYSDEYYEQYITCFEPNMKKRYFYRFVKRSFDIVASLLGLIIASPLFLLIAIAIKLDSKGPVIFRQKRLGKGGKEFNCLKFRSMKIDTPKDCATSLLKNPEKHYTRVGRVLRKLSLDELPQLWCVFIGKMSFIGYRPLVLTESNCNDMRARLGVFSLRPGISGYAQVHGRDDLYYKNKAILDAIYVKNASVWFDLKLVFHTVWVVLKREGNDAEKVKVEKEASKETVGATE